MRFDDVETQSPLSSSTRFLTAFGVEDHFGCEVTVVIHSVLVVAHHRHVRVRSAPLHREPVHLTPLLRGTVRERAAPEEHAIRGRFVTHGATLTGRIRVRPVAAATVDAAQDRLTLDGGGVPEKAHHLSAIWQRAGVEGVAAGNHEPGRVARCALGERKIGEWHRRAFQIRRRKRRRTLHEIRADVPVDRRTRGSEDDCHEHEGLVAQDFVHVSVSFLCIFGVSRHFSDETAPRRCTRQSLQGVGFQKACSQSRLTGLCRFEQGEPCRILSFV